MYVIVNFTLLSLKSCEKLATKCGGVFLTALSISKVTLILKLLILEGFLGLYHGHILSLSHESMISIEHLKWYAFERILYTTHSTNREKDSYNLTFNFSTTLFYIISIIFKSYIFVTARKYSDQILGESTNNFTIHMYLGKIAKILPIFYWLF